MAKPLKSGVATRYLLPIIIAYALAAGFLPAVQVFELQPVLGNFGGAAIVGVVLLVFQDLIPRPMKEALIFGRVRNRLPGCRAFSVIAKLDPRVDQARLAELLPTEPMAAYEENAIWYRWLKSVETEPMISDNHHRFLALRDCAILLLLLAVVSPFLAILPFMAAQSPLLLTAGCAAAYLTTALAARNAAIRLVGNVIALKVASS